MKHLSFTLILAAMSMLPADVLSAQTLSLEEAIALGLANNRTVANAALQVDKADHDIATARSYRLPSFKIDTQASQLLKPVDISFNRGAFGELPGVGPVPATDTVIRTPAQLNLLITAEAQQPLTHLIKVNLNVHLSEASKAYQREVLRDARLGLVDEIRRVYYAIGQTRAALDANLKSLALLQELNRVVATRVSQQVALKTDSLSVQQRIAQTEVSNVALRNSLASQKEQLNELIGRDLRTSFDVVALPETTIEQIDLSAAQGRAVDARPDVKQARVKLEQAELSRRVAKADYIPEIGIAVRYMSPINIDGAPSQIATAAIKASWEPWDWGRRGRAVASKDIEIHQARNNVRETEERALLEVNTRFRKLEEMRVQLRAARVGQEAARENVRIRLTQYDVQAALLSDVLQTQSSLADSDSQYQQALAAFWTARADFERALGEDTK